MKGQFTIIGVLMTFMTLIVYAAVLPVINDTITRALPGLDPVSSTLLSLLPLFMVIMILITPIVYGQPTVGGRF